MSDGHDDQRDDDTGAATELSNNDGGANRPPRLPRSGDWRQPPRLGVGSRPPGGNRALPPGLADRGQHPGVRFLGGGEASPDEATLPSVEPDDDATPLLDAHGRDLTALARAGDLPDIVGRDAEILHLAQTLLRRDRPSPLLVGEPGVGRAAIVEGLAARAAAEGADPRLARLRIIYLAIEQLGGEAVIRSRMTNRFGAVLDEVAQHPETILFIDGIHHLLGGMPMEIVPSEVMRTFLMRYSGQVIGTTTPRFAEGMLNPQRELAGVMLPITVNELAEADARTLIERQVPEYAAHHGVEITPAAVEAALRLSVRYVTQAWLPRKASELIDIAATQRSLPALTVPAGSERPTVDPEAIVAALYRRWNITVPEWTPDRASDDDDAAPMIAPSDLAERLAQRILGQSDAIAATTDAVRVAALGLRPGDRPRAVMLFGGPTGVGKTALARNLAVALFGSEDALLRIDMSEFQQQHVVARLLGAPPGFVGYHDGGQLSRFLRAHPESVILLDEIEKAHPQALDIFLQLFDAGRITDGHGQVLNARHAVFIMTTNVPMSDNMAALRSRLRPEFLNRIDRIVRFRALELADLERIAEQRLEMLAAHLNDRQITLRVAPGAVTALARPESDGRAANGRTIERRIDQEVAGPVAEWAALLHGLTPGRPVALVLEATETGTRVAPPGGAFDLHA